MQYPRISNSGMMPNYNDFSSRSVGHLPSHSPSHGHPPPTFRVGSQLMTVKDVIHTENRMPQRLPQHMAPDSLLMPRAVEQAPVLSSQTNAQRARLFQPYNLLVPQPLGPQIFPGAFPPLASIMPPPSFPQVNTNSKPPEQLTGEQNRALNDACRLENILQHNVRLGLVRHLKECYQIPEQISIDWLTLKQHQHCSNLPTQIPQSSQDESASSTTENIAKTSSKGKRKNAGQTGVQSQKQSRRGGMTSNVLPRTMPVLSPQLFGAGNIAPATCEHHIGPKQRSFFPAGPSISKDDMLMTTAGQPVKFEELIASGYVPQQGGLKGAESPAPIVSIEQISPEAGHASTAELKASTEFSEFRTTCQEPQVPAEYSSMLKNILEKPSTLNFKRSQSYSYGDVNDEAVASSSLASSQFNVPTEPMKPDSSQRGGAEQHCRKKAYIRQHSDDLSERSSFKLLQSGSPAMQPFHSIASTSTSLAGLFPKSMAMTHREDLASKTEAMINALTDKMDRNVDTEFATVQNTEKVDSDDDGGGSLVICEDSPNKRYSPVSPYGYDTGAEQRPSGNEGKFSS